MGDLGFVAWVGRMVVLCHIGRAGGHLIERSSVGRRSFIMYTLTSQDITAAAVLVAVAALRQHTQKPVT